MKKFKIWSDAFKNNKPIPVRFTFQGKSINPRFHWNGIPEATRELALICEDDDVPTPKPVIHWLIYGIDPSTPCLPENLPKRKSISLPLLSARQGLNSFLFSGYIGPNPGFWDPAHHYQFKLFALREKLNLPPGSGRKEFYRAIEGKVIDEAEIVGTYAKTPFQRIKAVAAWSGLIAGTGFLIKRAFEKKSDVELTEETQPEAA